jgi:hypothetical protein
LSRPAWSASAAPAAPATATAGNAASIEGSPSIDMLLPVAAALLLLPYLPASGLAFDVGFTLAERIMYLPAAGFALLAGAAFAAAAGHHVDAGSTASIPGHSKTACGSSAGAIARRQRLRAVLAAAAGLAVAVAIPSIAQNNAEAADWSSGPAFWASVLRDSPRNAKAWYSLGVGVEAGEEGALEAAVAALQLHGGAAVRISAVADASVVGAPANDATNTLPGAGARDLTSTPSAAPASLSLDTSDAWAVARAMHEQALSVLPSLSDLPHLAAAHAGDLLYPDAVVRLANAAHERRGDLPDSLRLFSATLLQVRYATLPPAASGPAAAAFSSGTAAAGAAGAATGAAGEDSTLGAATPAAALVAGAISDRQTASGSAASRAGVAGGARFVAMPHPDAVWAGPDVLLPAAEACGLFGAPSTLGPAFRRNHERTPMYAAFAVNRGYLVAAIAHAGGDPLPNAARGLTPDGLAGACGAAVPAPDPLLFAPLPEVVFAGVRGLPRRAPASPGADRAPAAPASPGVEREGVVAVPGSPKADVGSNDVGRIRFAVGMVDEYGRRWDDQPPAALSAQAAAAGHAAALGEVERAPAEGGAATLGNGQGASKAEAGAVDDGIAAAPADSEPSVLCGSALQAGDSMAFTLDGSGTQELCAAPPTLPRPATADAAADAGAAAHADVASGAASSSAAAAPAPAVHPATPAPTPTPAPLDPIASLSLEERLTAEIWRSYAAAAGAYAAIPRHKRVPELARLYAAKLQAQGAYSDADRWWLLTKQWQHEAIADGRTELGVLAPPVNSEGGTAASTVAADAAAEPEVRGRLAAIFELMAAERRASVRLLSSGELQADPRVAAAAELAQAQLGRLMTRLMTVQAGSEEAAALRERAAAVLNAFDDIDAAVAAEQQPPSVCWNLSELLPALPALQQPTGAHAESSNATDPLAAGVVASCSAGSAVLPACTLALRAALYPAESAVEGFSTAFNLPAAQAERLRQQDTAAPPCGCSKRPEVYQAAAEAFNAPGATAHARYAAALSSVLPQRICLAGALPTPGVAGATRPVMPMQPLALEAAIGDLLRKLRAIVAATPADAATAAGLTAPLALAGAAGVVTGSARPLAPVAISAAEPFAVTLSGLVRNASVPSAVGIPDCSGGAVGRASVGALWPADVSVSAIPFDGFTITPAQALERLVDATVVVTRLLNAAAPTAATATPEDGSVPGTVPATPTVLLQQADLLTRLWRTTGAVCGC